MCVFVWRIINRRKKNEKQKKSSPYRVHAETIVCKQKLKNIAKFAPLSVRLVLRRTRSRRTADLDTGKTRRASDSDREEEEENSHEEMRR